MAVIGSGFAEGPERASIAWKEAVACPLLEDVNLNNAKGILVNISASSDFKMREHFEVMENIKKYAAGNATIIVGCVIDDTMTNSLRVTMVATGLSQNNHTIQDDVITSFSPSESIVDDEADDEAASEKELNVFSPNEESDEMNAFDSNSDDKYDIPTFLRNNK